MKEVPLDKFCAAEGRLFFAHRALSVLFSMPTLVTLSILPVLSEARIQQLMDANFLRMPSDVFTIANDEEKLKELAELDGWGAKSAKNMASAAKRVASDGCFSVEVHIFPRNPSCRRSLFCVTSCCVR